MKNLILLIGMVVCLNCIGQGDSLVFSGFIEVDTIKCENDTMEIEMIYADYTNVIRWSKDGLLIYVCVNLFWVPKYYIKYEDAYIEIDQEKIWQIKNK